MKRYVALLRGINVGGNNMIKMKDLVAEFERLGFIGAITYINSGNVIFESDIGDDREIRDILEKELSLAFGYSARVFIRDAEEMRNIVKHFPEIFNDADWRHNVIFLSEMIDTEDILERFEIKDTIEKLYYSKGVLFWSARKDAITKSSMLKLAARKEYKEMTIRNINTTARICELLDR